MKVKLLAKTAIIGLLILAAFGCQNQTNSNSANMNNSNVSANDANNTNQTAGEIPSPQNIKFESADKVEIVGTFYESMSANSSAVLLLHQFGSDRKSFEKFAKHLQQKGFGVLAIDGRGFGESVKTTDGKTVEAQRTADGVKGMEADVAGAFDFLSNRKNVDAAKIGIVGASYGSSLALIYAAGNPKVKAVVLLSPGINYFDNLPTEPAIKNYGNRPLLLIAAEDDKESADAVRKLNETNAKSEMKIYEKGGHGTNIFDENDSLQDLLEQFLMKNL